MRFLLAFDTQDNDLGDFWHICMTDIAEYMSTHAQYSWSFIQSDELAKETIGNKVATYEGNSFVFLAYSHGQRDSLHGQYEVYVDTSSAYLFGGAFFYTFSCHVGTDLGPSLIANNCKAFIGYEDKAQIEVNNQERFAQCANTGFKSFLQDKNVWECVCDIRNAYDMAMENAYEDDNMAAYSAFRRNRDSICFHGDRNLKITGL